MENMEEEFLQETKKEKVIHATEFTLMKAIEKVVVALHDSNLDPEDVESCQDAIDYLKTRCSFSDMQAMMFSLCVDQSMDPQITIADLRRWIGCPMICLLSHQDELDALVDKGVLVLGEPAKTTTYAVPKYVMDGLKRNELITHTDDANLEFSEFFDRLGDVFNRRRNGLRFSQAKVWIDRLVQENTHLTYCKHILSLKGLKDDEMVLLHFVCHRAVNHDDFYINENDVAGILDRRSDVATNFRKLRMGRHPLAKKDLLECMNGDGMGIPSSFTLTDHARTTLLVEADLEVEEVQTISSKELVSAESIKQKDMFYNASVGEEISRLSSLLGQEQFQDICERLSSHGMRRGFACLFYGAPGTGKTETALQLARMTGRDIMQVNISDMRSKWVGESEKMVKGLFDRYRKAVESSKVAPILLFNEADALLTRRNDNTTTSVDKMENAMQNIFLQEIESMEGILIATTNLTSNLDAAFERRFLYKVNFEKPDAECRGKLWKSMIKDISDTDASKLASTYDFSGGQIENIARKHIVDTILYGDPEKPFDSLSKYCETELISNKKTARVGFVL